RPVAPAEAGAGGVHLGAVHLRHLFPAALVLAAADLPAQPLLVHPDPAHQLPWPEDDRPGGDQQPEQYEQDAEDDGRDDVADVVPAGAENQEGHAAGRHQQPEQHAAQRHHVAREGGDELVLVFRYQLPLGHRWCPPRYFSKGMCQPSIFSRMRYRLLSTVTYSVLLSSPRPKVTLAGMPVGSFAPGCDGPVGM